MPGPARIHRIALHARQRRRQRHRQDVAARRPGTAREGGALRAADGYLSPGASARARRSWSVLGRRAGRAMRRVQELPRQVGRRPNRTWKRSSPSCELWDRCWSSWTKPTRRRQARGGDTTEASRAGSTRCSPRRCRTRATAAGFIWVFATSRPDLLEVDLKRRAGSTCTSRSSRRRRPTRCGRCSGPSPAS